IKLRRNAIRVYFSKPVTQNLGIFTIGLQIPKISRLLSYLSSTTRVSSSSTYILPEWVHLDEKKIFKATAIRGFYSS
ncbi:MAG: hypothetical protein MI702_14960, partial [Chlorobiales bacterium]|nr:hypothetical protein [Chlorobiales bacterium]